MARCNVRYVDVFPAFAAPQNDVGYAAMSGHLADTAKTTKLTQCMVRPCGARDFDELVVSGLASMYQTSDWSIAPGHHGYQRACELISGQASAGYQGHQGSRAPGRPNLHLLSFSRRPRRVS